MHFGFHAILVMLCAIGIAFVIALAFAALARSKGRNPIIWGFLIFFFQLPALILLLMLPKREKIKGKAIDPKLD